MTEEHKNLGTLQRCKSHEERIANLEIWKRELTLLLYGNGTAGIVTRVRLMEATDTALKEVVHELSDNVKALTKNVYIAAGVATIVQPVLIAILINALSK